MPALLRASTAPSRGEADAGRGEGLLAAGLVLVEAGGVVPGTGVEEHAASASAAAMFNARPRLSIGRGVYGIRPRRVASSEPTDPSGWVITPDDPPANAAHWNRAEGSRIGARGGRVTREFDKARVRVQRSNTLDQLARRIAGIGGEDDLSHAWSSAGVAAPLDQEPLPGEERRGHRAALNLDHIEPTSREGDGGNPGAEREATYQKGREGPVAAPLRGHRS